ncbi:MAG TPA: SpoIID/LytB domain-containing protein [Tepidisphaeraceae bacterium]|nr:SpoIID/LytB domain-containing protein [Tepidisphaeraceae bacterium]
MQIDDVYISRALQAQENAAGFNINPEALKALAVADRSLAYYSIKAQGMIGNGGVAPAFDLNLSVAQQIAQAANETEREILQIGAQPVVGYSVDGARPTGGTPFGVANLSLDPDPTATEKFVTYNLHKSGKQVIPSPIGPKANGLNRGALSIQGADFLADHGWNYLDILHFYYGTDAQLTLGNGLYQGTSLDGATTYTPVQTARPTTKKHLADFEHDAGALQSAGTKNNFDQFINFKNNATAAMRSTKTAHGGRASELFNIGYDAAKAHGAPFTYRILSGAAGAEGTNAGNMLLPSEGQIGFYLETKTAGLITHLAVNDVDGTESSSNHKIIADGKWHKYVWNLGSSWGAPVKGKTDGKVTGPFSLNSISISGTSNASVRIDDLFFAEPPEGFLLPGNGGGAYQSGNTSGGTLTAGNIGTLSGISSGGSAVTLIGAGTLILAGGGTTSIGTPIILTGSGVPALNGGTWSYTSSSLIENSGNSHLDHLSLAPQLTGVAPVSPSILGVVVPEPVTCTTILLPFAMLLRRRR